jgi:hypothetical protein
MSNSSGRARGWLPVGVALGVAALLAVGVPSGSSSTTQALKGSINQVDRVWTCTGPVDLDSVSVTINGGGNLPNQGTNNNDAVHLRAGCTGRIGRITIVQYRGDGIKVGVGVHDLVIGGGSIRCYGHDQGKHQDGIQAMGGQRVTFMNLDDQCESANNAAFFVNKGTKNPTPPSDIICDGCILRGGGITVRIYNSVRSGIRNSRVVSGKLRPLSSSKSTVDLVNVGNTFLPMGADAGTAGGQPSTAPSTGQPSTPSSGQQQTPALPGLPRIKLPGKLQLPLSLEKNGKIGIASAEVKVDRAVLLLVSAIAGPNPSKGGSLLPMLKESTVAGVRSGRQHTTIVGRAKAGRTAAISIRLPLKSLRAGTAYNLRVTATDAATGQASTLYVPFKL